MRKGRSSFNARLWFGLVILALGVLWTFDNLGLLDAGEITRWWPLLLVGFGLLRLTGVGVERRPGVGLVFLVIGGALALDSFNLLDWDLRDAWPLVLIFVGGAIAWRSLRGPHQGRGGIEVHVVGAERRADAGGPPEADTFSCVAVWAGVDRKSTSQALKGGDFTAVMGGGELDLRAAKPAPGGAEIEVLVMMGGLDIMVPEDWGVVNEATVVMGALEDSRKVGVPAGDRTLIIKGFVMWGGVEIKN